MWTCGKISFHVAITTFAAEVYQETCKCQKDPLYCESEKLVYLLKYKVCGVVPYVVQTKTKFFYRFYNWKQWAFKMGNQKVPQKHFHACFCLDGHSGIDDQGFVIFQPCKLHEQFKEGEKVWWYRLKTF